MARGMREPTNSAAAEMTTAYAADAAWNDTFWKNPRFNELLVSARAETDEAKRQAMYAEMQQIAHDDGGQVEAAADGVDRHQLAGGLGAGAWPNSGPVAAFAAGAVL